MLSGFENTEEAYGIFTQLWDRAIDVMMQEVTSMRPYLSSVSSSTRTWLSRQPRQPTAQLEPDHRKRVLDAQRLQKKYGTIFRLPPNESVQGELLCRWDHHG